MNDLDPFVAALRRQRHAMVGAEVSPDAMDVVDRALAMDPKRVADGLRAEVSRAARASDAGEDFDDGLAPFVAALRGKRQAQVDAGRLRPLAQPKRPSVAVWGVALAVAAAAALIIVLPRLRTTAEGHSRSVAGQEAERSAAQQEAEGAATERRREPAPNQRSASQAASDAPPDIQPDDLPESQAEVALEVEPPRAPATRAPTNRQSLDELEVEARAAWQAGSLSVAERNLRAVVLRSGSSRRAELAYADLFALARQHGDAAAQNRLWKQYLAKFPHGRFADDVRASLCRAVDGERSLRCWETYLREHPQGAHATQAHEALQRARP